MNDMPKLTNMFRRGSTYHVRRRVPVDLLETYAPKKELTRTTGKKDCREAAIVAHRIVVEMDEEFERQRHLRDTPPLSTISDEWAERLGALWLSHLLEEDEELRRDGFEGSSFEKWGETLEIVDACGGEAYARGDVTGIDFEMTAFLEAHGVAMETGSSAYRKVAHEFLKAGKRASEMALKRQSGEVVDTPDPPTSVHTQATRPDSSDDGPRVSSIVALWAERRHPTAQSQMEWARAWTLFGELHGDLSIGGITKDHVRQFRDLVERMPKDIPNAVRALPLADLVAWADEQGDWPRVSITTARKRMTAIKSTLGWAEDDGLIDTNPAQRITVRDDNPSDDGEVRVSYSDDDLRVIFEQSPVYAQGARPTGGRGEAAYWLPVMALFSGARMAELGQLYMDDIDLEGEVPSFRVGSAHEGQRVKSKSSRRVVPLHPEVLQLGFADYVGAVRRGKHEMLFPLLDGRPGDHKAPRSGWSKWWGRYCDRLGIIDRAKVFHSFRHGFKDKLRASRVPEWEQRKIMGHTAAGHQKSDAADDYGKSDQLALLAEHVASVRFDGLAIHPWPG